MADAKISQLPDGTALTLTAADILPCDHAGGTFKVTTSQVAAAGLGFTPENVVNKTIDGTLAANSDTLYPSEKAVKTYADTKQPLIGYTPANDALVVHLAGAEIITGTKTLTPAANSSALIASGFLLTGANAQSLFDLSGIWNTSGNPTALKVNVTNTASGVSSLLLDLQKSGASQFSVAKDGTTVVGAGAITFNNDSSAVFGTTQINSDGSFHVASNQATILVSGEVRSAFLTANRALISNASKGVDVSLTTDTELGYVHNVTSAIQTQLNARATTATTITIAGTANQVISSAGAQDLSANRTWTLSTPQNIDTGATPQFARIGIGAAADATAAILSTPAANAQAVKVSGFSLTAANAQSVIDVAGTWNTSGTPTAVLVNILNTASNAASLLLDLQIGSVSQFKVTRAGAVTAVSTISGTTLSASTRLQSNSVDPSGSTLSIGNFATQYVTVQAGQNDASTSGTKNIFGITPTFTTAAGSASFRICQIAPTYNFSGAQTGTMTDLFINATETALQGATHNLLDAQVGAVSKFSVDNTGKAVHANLTASTALVADANKAITSSATTSTELGYVSGVTSAIQTQLNNKVYSISFSAALKLLAAGNTFYFGNSTSFGPNTQEGVMVVPIALAGTVIAWWFCFSPFGGTNPSGENITSSLRLNNTTDFGSTTNAWNVGTTATLKVAVTGLTQAVAVNDYLEVKFVTPAMTTAPNGCCWAGALIRS